MKKYLFVLALAAIFTLPATSHAAFLYYGGYELNSTTDGVEYTTNSAPIATSSTAHSGSYSGRVLAGNGFWRQVLYTSNQTATGTVRIWVNPHVYPNASTRLAYLATTANVFQGNITMATDGTLLLLKANGTQIGSASSALPLDTWSCVEFRDEPTTGANGTLTGRLNGSTFATGANSAAGSWARALWGNITGSQTTNDLRFDDIEITDGLSGFPGCGSSVFMSPNAAGDANTWLQTAGGAGSATNYQLVDEIPPNDATDFVNSGTLNNDDFYNFTDSGLHTYDTINALFVGSRHNNNTADATTAYKVVWKPTSGGTISTAGTAMVPGDTTWRSWDTSTDATDVYKFATTTTTDGTALTSTILDAMQAGFRITAANVNRIQATALWAYADYTAGTPPPSTAGSGLLLFE